MLSGVARRVRAPFSSTLSMMWTCCATCWASLLLSRACSRVPLVVLRPRILPLSTFALPMGSLASMTISDATASPWNWEATAREDPQYRPFDADAYFIGGTKGALSLPRLHQMSYDGASSWHKPLQMDIPAVDPALPHKMQLKHFVRVVRREEAPVVTPADNVKTLRCLNAVKQAAETGQLVELA